MAENDSQDDTTLSGLSDVWQKGRDRPGGQPRDKEPLAGLPIAGQTWGKYLIERPLGTGGQADVFQAYDRFGAAGHVALKVARSPVPDGQARAWTQAEAEPLVKLDHPNIVRVVDAGCVNGTPYVATRLVEGLPLPARVKSNPPSIRRILDWMIQLVRAVAYAHEQGIIHRDLKASNIIVTPEGQPRIIDFGISSLIDPYEPEHRARSSGTLFFMPPEQAGGDPQADHRIDVFALGGVLKFLLTGTGPYGPFEQAKQAFQGILAGKGSSGSPDDIRQRLRAYMTENVEFVAKGSGPPMRRALARIANRATNPDPGKRFQNAREMLRALGGLRNRRRVLAVGAAAAVLVAAVIAVAVFLADKSQTSPAPTPPTASLVVHFQRAGQKGAYQILAPDLLTLRTDDSIQIHAELPEAMVAYLVTVDPDGRMTVVGNCPKCGTRAAEDAAFCTECGARVAGTGGARPVGPPASRPTAKGAGSSSSGGATEAASRKVELMATYRVAQRLKNLGRHTEAARAYERAVALAPAVFGSDHPNTSALRNNFALLYMSMGQYTKAETLFLQNLKIHQAKLDKDHQSVATSLNNLAVLYKSMGQYDKAEPLFLQSLKIYVAVLGKNHRSVAQSLSNLAALYQAMAEYDKAEPLFQQSLHIYEGMVGSNHPSVAQSLDNLAVLYHSMGEHAKAEPLFLRSLKIREATLGKDHSSVAQSLNNLAGLYRSMAQYSKAGPLCLRSLSILEVKLGKDHPSVATSLINLAGLYHGMGQYARAEPLYLRGLKIYEAKLGKDHPYVATSLINLAGLYHGMGQYARAEPLYLRGLKIYEAEFGKDHPYVATSLNNLAVLYCSMGEHAKAEPLYLRRLKRREAKLGKDHPSVATSLSHLASLYRSIGEHAKAEPLYLRGLKIREAMLGKDHPSVATSLINLAGLYHGMGQYARAETLYLRGLKIREAMLGKDHPDVGLVLYNLSFLHAQREDYRKAWPLARRAIGILAGARSRAGRSPLARSSFMGGVGYGDLPICLALKTEEQIDFLELLEQQRAMGLRELLGQARAQAADTLGQADRKRMLVALGRINALNAAIQKRLQKDRPVEALGEELRRAERQYDSLMGELDEKHHQFVATETAHAVTSKQVAETPALDDETAIVGWVVFRDWAWGYVIRRTGVKWVDLSEGFDRVAMRRLRVRVLTAAHTPAASRLSPIDLHRTYDESLAPLDPHLKGIRKLIVIAQGWSAYLPVEMLLTRKPSTGAEDMANWPWLDKKYGISYAPSCTTLDILCRQREKRKNKQWPRPLFALADPPFSAEQLARMKSEKESPLGQLFALADPAPRSDSMLTRLLRFDAKAVPSRLPGTRREARMIVGLLGAEQSLLLLGPDASERKLFEASKAGQLKQCRYVHLATHGFADNDRPEFSGLALARVPADKDYDGVLHMREVFQLKLDADLVVLSACQTGLGKDLGGEGILGLSTAFFFAGAPSIVMSLWDVPDAPTALLMHRFYSNLKAGKTKAAALREAKNWLRNLTRNDLAKLGRTENPALRELTRGLGKVIESEKGRLLAPKPFAHPHYWAGFILTGDPQ